VFGSAIAVGFLGTLSVWESFHNSWALLIFVLIFAAIFWFMVYVVKKRKLGMLETR
jgi:hypothetical protein